MEVREVSPDAKRSLFGSRNCKNADPKQTMKSIHDEFALLAQSVMAGNSVGVYEEHVLAVGQALMT